LYLRHVAEFAKHFHRSPDQLGAEDIRQPQLFLIQEKKLAWSSYNQIVCALRFFYTKTLQRAFLLQEIPFPRMEQRLPTILSREEVARILTVPPHLKTRALLMTIYAAGLRRSEAAHLRVNDIDSARMTITVRQGKGQKDRLVMLSPVLLETLRQYWRHNKPKQWLFPGENPDQPISDNDVFAVFHNAASRWNHQEGLAAFAAPLSRLPDYVEPIAQGPVNKPSDDVLVDIELVLPRLQASAEGEPHGTIFHAP
jgi:integrase/recombinase XerD